MRTIYFLAATMGLSAAYSGPADARSPTEQEKKVISEAVSRQLKDPYAAKFVFPALPILKDGGMPFYCGLVNSKNSYGAYVGETPFGVALVVRKGNIVGAIPIGDLGNPSSSTTEATMRQCAAEGRPLR
jgi:hypothetical protein